MAERLAQWASDARNIGVTNLQALGKEIGTRQMAVQQMANTEAKLARVRQIAFGCIDDDPATHEAAALEEIKKVLND